MNDHHLIMGELTDYLTGQTRDDTHDERYLQKIARMLILEKRYDRSEIRSGLIVDVQADARTACVPVAFTIALSGRAAMLIHYGPGSLVTRHRPALALARLAAADQIPVVVVTNGEQADILDGLTGKVTGAGLAEIPSKEQLEKRLKNHVWATVSPERAKMEARIVMAYEVDDRCPCDSTICVKEIDG